MLRGHTLATPPPRVNLGAGSAPAGEHAADPTCGQRQHDARHLRHLRRQGLRLGGRERGRALRRRVDAVAVDVEHGVGQLLVVEQERGEALGAWWGCRWGWEWG